MASDGSVGACRYLDEQVRRFHVIRSFERPSLKVVSENAHGLGRAMAYWAQLTRNAGSPEDLIPFLRARIAESTRELVKALGTFDSFDTLAFLRMSTRLGDFTDLRESNSTPETSYSAPEIVAHALLGMGLPRTPLIGDFGHPPSPSELLRLSGSILEDARCIAITEGLLSDLPLARLAGHFKGYELSVRGRQYSSVAEDINTGLLDGPAVAAILRNTLGFALTDVRAVRAAGIHLLESRFFGARDRVGDLTLEHRDGTPLSDTDKARFTADIVLMMVECRRFGAINVTDVAVGAGVPEDTARLVLDYFAATRPGADAAAMVDRFCRGERIQPWGCIADHGEYLLLDGFLGEDELRRDVERGLVGTKQWNSYDRQRARFAEARAVEALRQLLGGEDPRWQAQLYLVPRDGGAPGALAATADPASVATKTVESDALFVVDGVALCVEVKAGSITDRARGGDVQRLARDLTKTLRDANEQADRLVTLIRTNHGVWDSKKRWIDLSEVREIHSIVVSLDDLGPLSLSMNELVAHGVIDTATVPWVVTLHDVIVMGRVLDHPAQFLSYVRRRCGRRLATKVTGVDELDMLMWFIDGGLFFDQDPREVAAQLPVDRPVTKAVQRRYDEQPPVQLGTMTDPLDAWFYWKDGLSQRQVLKPTRREALWIEAFLDLGEATRMPGWLRIGADMVGLSSQDQRRRGNALKDQRSASRKARAERSLTAHVVNEQGPWLMVIVVRPKDLRMSQLYTAAKKYQTRSDRSILLVVDADGAITHTTYDDEPWKQSDDRDRAVAALPLLSLEETFRASPPKARGTRNRKRKPHRKKR